MEPLVNEMFQLPMVALRGLSVFPNTVLRFDLGRKQSIAAVREAMQKDQTIFLVAQKSMAEEIDTQNGIYRVGVVCEVKQIMRAPSGEQYRVLVEGKYRAALLSFNQEEPFLVANLKALATQEPEDSATEKEALIRYTKNLFETFAAMQPKMPTDIIVGVLDTEEVGKLADYTAGNLPLSVKDKQELLEELDDIQRLEKLCVKLSAEIRILESEEKIAQKVESQMDENQREYYLREQMRAISDELGEGDLSQKDAQKFRQKIDVLPLEEESKKKLLEECDRLERLQPSSPESAVARTYLETVLNLPFGTYTKDSLSLEKARKVLDKAHYGLTEVKDRIIELLAVRKLNPDIKGQILCLVGPPGVGKTSIAQSLAEAMHRNFARISLGGVGDEAEIRGHRKTYIGSMPGNIVDALTRAKSMNPLILLDEIDKMSKDYKGDPASALLEVLDPEQNHSFRDHYVEIPVDLSKVLFVTTANDLSTVPAPLLDRMEVIELYSYTAEEKFHIAKKHLLPKQLKEHGITAQQLRITDDALQEMIAYYTREAGVRKLERTIAKTIRKNAVQIAKDPKKRHTVNAKNLEAFLGARKYKAENALQHNGVGVINGLAWTSVGGELLKVEAVIMDGTGKLELTGSLGEVMQESAKAAFSFVRANAKALHIATDFYKKKDIHIHFPEGAVPKDGPSAGVTVTTALVSALTGREPYNTVAMTGEVTITGRVLPIGGLREKSMAAYKAGMKTVLIPAENYADLEQVDETVKQAVQFIPVEHVSEVLQHALLPMQTECESTEEKKTMAYEAIPQKKNPLCRNTTEA